MAVAALVVVAGLCLTGFVSSARSWSSAGWNDPPPKITRRPVAADVVGTWQYTADAPRQQITITFNTDGTYHQSVSPPAATATAQVQDGRWDLKDGFVNVPGALMREDGGWKPRIDGLAFWDVVQSRQRPGESAICGGIYPDPDCYQEFTKLK